MTAPITYPALALDTSTELCSVALQTDRNATIQCHQKLLPRAHAKHILDMIQGLLDDAHIHAYELSTLVYGQGPGSFTGVRLGAAVTQGLALASGAQVRAVSSLLLIAEGLRQQTGHAHLRILSDARMQEVYWNDFHWYNEPCDRFGWQMTQSDQLSSPHDLMMQADAFPSESMVWAGTGLSLMTAEFSRHGPPPCLDVSNLAEDCLLPSAQYALSLCHQQPGLCAVTDVAVPVYIRNDVAHVKTAR